MQQNFIVRGDVACNSHCKGNTEKGEDVSETAVHCDNARDIREGSPRIGFRLQIGIT